MRNKTSRKALAAMAVALPVMIVGFVFPLRDQARAERLPSCLGALAGTCRAALSSAPLPIRAGWRVLRGASLLLTTDLTVADDLHDAPGPMPEPRLAAVGLLPTVGLLGAQRGMPLLPPPPEKRR